MLLADGHNNKNKFQISHLNSKTAFLILFYVVMTQKLKTVNEFLHLAFFLVSLSDLLSLFPCGKVMHNMGIGRKGYSSDHFQTL